MRSELKKKLSGAACLALAVMTAVSAAGCEACGKSWTGGTSGAAIESVYAEDAEQIPDIETAEPLEEDGDAEEVVTVKAGPDGTPLSATIKRGSEPDEKVSTAELPFDVKITYWLDEEEISPEKLAGAEGQLRIRFDYTNKARTTVSTAGGDVETMVPLAFITVIALPSDRFSDVEVANGSVTSVSGNDMVIGYAMPGLRSELGLDRVESQLRSTASALDDETAPADIGIDIPDYVEISAYTRDCRIEFTSTIVKNGLLADVEEGDIEEIRDMISGLGDLTDMGDELSSGASALASGASELGSGIGQYVSGVDSLAEGAGSLSSGASQLSGQSDALKSGAAQLAEGLGTLEQMLSSMDPGSGISVEFPDADSVYASAYAAAESAALESLAGNETLTEEDKNAIARAAAEAAAGTAVQEAMGPMADVASALEQIPDTSEIVSAVSVLAAGASELSGGIDAYTAGVNGLADGAAQLASGARSLAEAGPSLTSGCAALSEGAYGFREAIDELDSRLFSNIASLADGALPAAVESLDRMRIADEKYSGFGIWDGSGAGVMYILETEEIK
ncbi:MAG: hypothetical protein K5774_03810 [Clostridia bacterium]|nr:hypothetical protein [Clostridia bacterium]